MATLSWYTVGSERDKREGKMSYGEVYAAESSMDRRLQERHNEAGARHLARQQQDAKGTGRFYAGALVRLGQCLIAWGSRLQERYRVSPANTTQPANRPLS
jgi:hypothetical protein